MRSLISVMPVEDAEVAASVLGLGRGINAGGFAFVGHGCVDRLCCSVLVAAVLCFVVVVECVI